MTADEWADWQRLNGAGEERPCRECPLDFAAEARGAGRCNGTPGGRVQPTVEAVVPCHSCAHALVCSYRMGVDRPIQVGLKGAPRDLPDGITLTVSATLTCRWYGRARRQSPETRAKIAAAARRRGRKAVAAA